MSGELPREELHALVADRHRALTAHLEFFRHEQDRSWAEQTVADSLILRHAIVRLEAETRWHEELLDAIPKLGEPDARAAARPSPPGGLER